MKTLIVLALLVFLCGCGTYPLVKYEHGSAPGVPGVSDQTFDFVGAGAGREFVSSAGVTEVEAAVGLKEINWNGESRKAGVNFSVTHKWRPR